MIARCVWTLATLFVAGCAFSDSALGIGYVGNPFGLLFLAIAAFVWFKWNAIIAAFRAAHDPSALPIIRFGYDAIKGAGFKTSRDAIPTKRSSGGD